MRFILLFVTKLRFTKWCKDDYFIFDFYKTNEIGDELQKKV